MRIGPLHLRVGIANAWPGEWKATRNVMLAGVTAQFNRGSWHAWILVLNVGVVLSAETVLYRREMLERSWRRVKAMLDERAAERTYATNGTNGPDSGQGCRGGEPLHQRHTDGHSGEQIIIKHQAMGTTEQQFSDALAYQRFNPMERGA